MLYGVLLMATAMYIFLVFVIIGAGVCVVSVVMLNRKRSYDSLFYAGTAAIGAIAAIVSSVVLIVLFSCWFIGKAL